MAFLVTQDCRPNIGPSVQSFKVVERDGMRLAVCAPAVFREIPGPIPGAPSNATAWILFEGHLIAADNQVAPEGFSGVDAIDWLIRNRASSTLGTHLSRLKGSFIAVVAMPATGKLIFIRDRLGARTGFYAKKGRSIALASEAHLPASLPEFGSAEDQTYMASMFSLRTPPPLGHSAFRHVSELEPGERVEIDRGVLEKYSRNWTPSLDPIPETPQQWVGEFNHRFNKAVYQSFNDDEAPCVMLSGGLDSGPVAAVAAQKLARKGKQLGAVSWRLPGFPTADESAYVKNVADYIGAKLIAFDADHLLSFTRLDESLVQPNRPSINFYRALILRCYELARDNNFDVILNGNAGDLIYPDHSWILSDQLRRGEIRQAIYCLKNGLSRHGFRCMLQYPPLRALLRQFVKGRNLAPTPPPAWLTQHARDSLLPDNIVTDADLHSFPLFASRLLGTWLGRGTSTENSVSARYGLERRDPFVDEGLVELVLAMPFSMSFREDTTKWVMREAMKKDSLLPESIRTKPRTGLLTVFLDAGFDANKAQISDFLFREHTEWQKWIDQAPVRRAISDHQESHRDRALAAVSIGYCLWLDKIKQLPKSQLI